jgi:hypothetical protein
MGIGARQDALRAKLIDKVLQWLREHDAVKRPIRMPERTLLRGEPDVRAQARPT